MKKVEAIIREEKLEALKNFLRNWDILYDDD